MMSDHSKQMSQAGGPAMIALGAIFIASVNAGLGAAFIAIGAALMVKWKKENDARG